VEDVARAFEVILHNGVTGKIYNIGGTHEKANIDVAKDLIRLMGKGDEEVSHSVRQPVAACLVFSHVRSFVG